MKKLFERLTFMVIGALLVSAAYLVGSTDKTANAQLTKFEDLVVTGNLIVKGSVTVGDLSADHGNLVHIKADDESSTILLLHNRSKHSRDASVMLSAKKIDGNPAASIKLQDKLGNSAIGTSDLGWSKHPAKPEN